MKNVQIINNGVKVNAAESERTVALNAGVHVVFQVSTDGSFLGSVFLLQLCLHIGFWTG